MTDEEAEHYFQQLKAAGFPMSADLLRQERDSLRRQLEEARKALEEMRDAAQPTSEMIEAGAVLLLETDAWYEVGDRARDLAKRVFLAMQAASRAMGEDK